MDTAVRINTIMESNKRPPQPWMQGALCRDGYDPLMWHPTGSKPTLTRPAIEICNRCPSEMRCLEYALKWNERYGIWGGKTEYQRKMLRKKIRKENPDWLAA